MRSTVYDQEQKTKLNIIRDAKEFAIEHLDLEANENYTKVYNQGSKPVLWIVTASEPFRLVPYEWNFPIVGKVFYKGYFDHSLAIQEEKRISAMGFDTDVSPVSAWSTLGFFNDPVLSGMLARDEGRLAELIIHEMTHATIYIESDVDFNENLATFIGEQGAIRFLKHRFGETSTEYSTYVDWLSDKKLYGSYMVNASARLDSLYNSFESDESIELRSLKKWDLIVDIMRGVNVMNFAKPERFRFDSRKNSLPDNTFFISYLKYRKDQDNLQQELIDSHKNDLKSFLESKKAKYAR